MEFVRNYSISRLILLVDMCFVMGYVVQVGYVDVVSCRLAQGGETVSDVS